MDYIKRAITSRITEVEKFYSVIVITGPRQVGKTTLCRHLWSGYTYYNLEDPSLRQLIMEDPKRFIFESTNNIIVDEVQNFPTLFSYIQLCVDENPSKRFVLTGSNNFALMENITQSLAGRAALFNLLPFSFSEIRSYIEETKTDQILFNGFYPGVIARQIPPEVFFSNYFATYVERDVRRIKSIENLDNFQLFMRILAGRVSTEFNASSISSACGISSPTVKAWLGILKTSYIVFAVSPYYANIEKRLTKTPKIYFYDTGLLCYLLGIENADQLLTHPLRGAVFENMIVAEFVKEQSNHGQMLNNLYYYREEKGREIDVVKVENSKLRLYEIKSGQTYNTDFSKNLKYLKNILGDKVMSTSVIYDGDSYMPEILNFRQLDK